MLSRACSLALLSFADLLGRDQGSTEKEDSGVTMIHVGDSGEKKEKKTLIF